MEKNTIPDYFKLSEMGGYYRITYVDFQLLQNDRNRFIICLN